MSYSSAYPASSPIAKTGLWPTATGSAASSLWGSSDGGPQFSLNPTDSTPPPAGPTDAQTGASSLINNALSSVMMQLQNLGNQANNPTAPPTSPAQAASTDPTSQAQRLLNGPGLLLYAQLQGQGA